MKSRIGLVCLTLIVSAGVGGWLVGQERPDAERASQPAFRGLSAAEARRLRQRVDHTVRERGVLESAAVVEIRSRVDEETTILQVVPEGSRVTKGQPLVRLDDSQLQDKLNQQRIRLLEAEAGVQAAEALLAARKRRSGDDFAVAEQALKVAELALRSEVGSGGRLETEIAESQSEIELAQRELELAKESLQRTEALIERNRADASDLRPLQVAAAEARSLLRKAEGRKRLLTEVERPYRTAVRELAVLQARTELGRLKQEREAAANEAEAEVRARRAEYELEKSRVERLGRQIENCRIRAPRDGIVVYAESPSRRTSGAGIEEGAAVRPRQPILQMPDLDRLQVRVAVHESKIDRVQKGQVVRLRFDAMPEKTIAGTVTEVSSVPEPTSWFQSDVKEYAVLVSLKTPPPALRLGMTCLAEIDVSSADR